MKTNENPEKAPKVTIHFKNNKAPSEITRDEALTSSTIMDNFFYLEYFFCPIKDEKISISIPKEDAFYLIYSWQGIIDVTDNDENFIEIFPFHSSLVYDRYASGIKLFLNQETAYQFCIIGFTKPKSETANNQETCFFKLKDTFLNHLVNASFAFTGKPNLKLLEKINSLSRISKKTLADELMMEGLIYQILGLKVEQLLISVNTDNIYYGSLSTKEMGQIQSLSNLIKKNPSLSYTIEYLCRETGMSPAKLQEGFKRMYGKTVINFIRHVRLEKATELIETTDLNISEIVYSIGLTSRSYFSKIFKNKYACSPKFFQEKFRAVTQNTVDGKLRNLS